ncbi:DUF1800 domain-containing protein [Lutimonas saemankumensis]|uniref:DUF1800 domain-containing protein n=1 Tax=Lutimonas saemankumensis TaxID=483016 RepID=UPI001CD282A3|nr:DUF1800 domain-containing protein [Lutimonas saemankumensis]MCA0932508.1 DUF1800 domain-containing protein [Lutimonas saemankumensis]
MDSGQSFNDKVMAMKRNHILHLYLRAGFGIGYSDLNALEQHSKPEVVSSLFRHTDQFDPLVLDLTELEAKVQANRKQGMARMDKSDFRDFQKKSMEKIKEFNAAWIDRMKKPEVLLNEKMTLFWANVFVCRDNNIFYVQHYNNTLRKYALGDFKQFVKAVSREAAMTKYLNNRQNVKESPNENFARELMELFTLGVGNYTEQDIKEAARAFTGWSFKRNGDFVLRQQRHDYGKKTFFGKTGNFDGDDIIDIILDQEQCARFICSKIYRYFVNPVIDEGNLDEITAVFYKDYDIKNLMAHIFSSEWFYDERNIGVKIKSPIELLVGIQTFVPVEFEQKNQLMYLQRMMGQVLLYPPNVAGWKGDRNWIDSNTLMFRMKLASLLLSNTGIDLDEKGEFEDSFEKYYQNQNNRKRFLKVSRSWEDFDRQYDDLAPEELKQALLIAKIDSDTENFLSKLKINDHRMYCVQLMSVPEYQLC